MPERWERELAKLREIEAHGSTVRGIVERGPTDRRLPGGRERVVAAVVAFAVFGAAGAFAWQALTPGLTSSADFGPGSWPVATISLHADADGKTATISTGGATQGGVFGAATSPNEPYPYAWVNPALPTIAQPLPIPMGSELALEGDDVVIKELLYGDAQQLDEGAGLDSGVIWSDQPDFAEPYFLPWDDEPERTYLKLFGTWADGSVLDVYFEVVFVEPTWDVSDATADIAVSPEPMEAALIYGGQRMPAALDGGQYGRASMTTELTGWDEDSIFAKVAAGSSITVSGDHLVEATAHFGPLPFGAEEGSTVESFPEEPGRSILTLDVTWDDGGATFLFPIEIVAAPQEDGGPPDEGVSPAPSPVSTDAVSVDIRRSDAPTSEDPRAVARFREQEIRICPNGWSLVGPDGERNEVLFDCGQEKEFTAAAGAPVTVTGDFVTVDVSAVGHEDRTQYAPNEVPGLDPGSIVTFTFDVEWADGSEASFWLLLTVSRRERPSPDPGDGEVDAAPALRIRCGEQGVEVLTSVVAAQPDGLHVSVDALAYWEIGLFPASEPRQSYWAESDMDDDEFARPVPPGQVGVACIDQEIITGAEVERLEAEASPFLLIDPDGLFTPYAPECDVSDQALHHWGLDGVDIEDASNRLRTLPGVRPDDMIQLAGYDWEWGSARMWRIVRDGRIIAGLRVGDQGGGVASGFVCRSSGITGDEEQ